MGSISIGTLSTGGCSYSCTITYDTPTRSGDNVTIKNVVATITSTSQYQTQNRIAISVSINGVSKVSNGTILSAYDTSYPTTKSYTVVNSSGYTFSCLNTSFSISATFRSTGYGSDWNSNYGSAAGSGNVTVTARTYTVSFDANGGSGAPSNQTKTYGTNLTLSSDVPTRTGYAFQGWATSSTGSVAYAAGGTYSTNADATLWAVWQINSWAVKYYANTNSSMPAVTGMPGNQTKVYNQALTLDTKSPACTGYTFQGWNTNAGGTGTNYAAGGTIPANVNAAVDLYAKWQIITYAVTYNKNTTDNVSNMPSNDTKNYGQAYTVLPQSGGTLPTRTGYSFQGWATTQGGSVVYTAGASYTTNAALNLYAVWQANQYDVTFDKNTDDSVSGMPTPNPAKKTYGVALTLSTAKPARTGYNFTGWNTAKNGSGTAYASGASYTNNEPVTLYAQWSIITYTVTYNGNGSTSGTTASQSKNYGASVNIRVNGFSRTGYTFSTSGWNTKADGTGTSYAVNQSYSTNANLALYAQWSIITYPVTYYPNGGSGAPSAQTKSYGITLSLSSTVPTRTGYDFLGWATSSSGSVVYQPGSAYTGNQALDLYAIWQAQKSTITTAANKTLGTACSIKWTPMLSSFKFKIKFAIGSWNYTTGYISPNTTSAYTYTGYTIPITTSSTAGPAFQITTSTTGTMTATLYTYDSNNTLLGEDSKTFTVTVPASCKPTVSPSISQTSSSSVVNGWGIYVAGYSKVRCQASATAQYDATITSVKVTGDHNATGTTSLDSTSGVMTAGTKTFTFTATDSRGMTSDPVEISPKPVVVAYAAPDLTSFQAVRQTSDVTKVNVLATWTYKDIGNNAATATLQYKQTSASSWTPYSGTITSGTATTLSGVVFADDHSYNIKLTITDSLGNSATREVYLPTIAMWEHMPAGGNGVAFGKVHEVSGHFESGWPLDVTGNITATGQVTGTQFNGAVKAQRLHNFYNINTGSANRPTTPNIESDNYGGMKKFLATASMTTDKPSSDGHIIHLDWDNGSVYASQLFIPNNTSGNVQYRVQTNSPTWSGSTWKQIWTENNLSSKSASSGGTDVSLVTTGEKYTWNNKSNLTIGTTATTAAAGNHTHSEVRTVGDERTSATTPNSYVNNIKFQGLKGNGYINTPSTDTYSYLVGLRGWSDSSGGDSHELAFNNTGIFWRKGATTSWGSWKRIPTSDEIVNHTHATSIATSSGTNQLTLAASTKYAITSGGTSYVFTTPPNTTYSTLDQTTANTGTETTGKLITAKVLNDTIRNKSQESYLLWGGKDFAGSYGVVDASMVPELGANRFAFAKAAGITVEYSTDGGSTWTDYGLTNAQKVGLFSSGNATYLGKHSAAGTATANDRLRVTLDTGAAGIYTTLNKIVIFMSTSGASTNTTQVLIEKALQSTPTTYTTHKDWTTITGWSGWNVLNISSLTTYGNTASSQYGRVRFTFKQTNPASSTGNYGSADILRILGFGGMGWTTPSNMAKDGHLYSYDSSQNATFPANVTATQFSGTLNGSLSSTTKTNVVNLIYPVGSIYMSVNSTNPSTLFGGTWVQLENRFLLGAGSSYTNGATGGAATHTLALTEIPGHAGHLNYTAGSSSSVGQGGWWLAQRSMDYYGSQGYGWSYANNEYYPTNVSRGGGGAHNNMPPYLVVYMWKRTG